MGAPHNTFTTPHYLVVRADDFNVPESLRLITGKSWAANSAQLRRTSSIALKVSDHLGRESRVQALAEANGHVRICANPYPSNGGGDAWLAVNDQGEAVFAARNLALCRLFAANVSNQLCTAEWTSPPTRYGSEAELMAAKKALRRYV